MHLPIQDCPANRQASSLSMSSVIAHEGCLWTNLGIREAQLGPHGISTMKCMLLSLDVPSTVFRSDLPNMFSSSLRLWSVWGAACQTRSESSKCIFGMDSKVDVAVNSACSSSGSARMWHLRCFCNFASASMSGIRTLTSWCHMSLTCDEP